MVLDLFGHSRRCMPNAKDFADLRSVSLPSLQNNSNADYINAKLRF